jgi:hypothetical protein
MQPVKVTPSPPQDRHPVVPLVARESGFSITDDIDGKAGITQRIDVATKVRITGKAAVADDRDTRLSGTFPHHDLVRGSVGLGPRRRAYSA